MATERIRVTRLAEQLASDDKRVIPRYLDFASPARIRSIFHRLAALSADTVEQLLADVRKRFSRKHRDLDEAFANHYAEAARHVRAPRELSEAHQLLIGSYFTMEYSIESAALFNPSIVPHPDQTGLAAGSARFLMSLRATGEGHVSSIVFRRGVIDRAGDLSSDPPPRYAYAARLARDRLVHKSAVERRLRDRDLYDDDVAAVLSRLDDVFTHAQLRAAIKKAAVDPQLRKNRRRLSTLLLWMAIGHYELDYPRDCLPSEIVLFPATRYESQGMEDLRLVRFVDEAGRPHYYGTYTAYDGRRVYPMLLETDDFHAFHISALSGRFSTGKGMALFPRLVNGSFAMLSRHDGENNYLLRSHDPVIWNSAVKLQTPTEPWELLQLGNSGSPLETDAGWLVITHGVGPMRQYCLGALLLDLHDPTRVLGRLRRPFLVPTEGERVGYVPNVVYSCGSMIHHGRLIVPYAMSDSRSSLVSVSLRALLRRLLDSGP